MLNAYGYTTNAVMHLPKTTRSFRKWYVLPPAYPEAGHRHYRKQNVQGGPRHAHTSARTLSIYITTYNEKYHLRGQHWDIDYPFQKRHIPYRLHKKNPSRKQTTFETTRFLFQMTFYFNLLRMFLLYYIILYYIILYYIILYYIILYYIILYYIILYYIILYYIILYYIILYYIILYYIILYYIILYYLLYFIVGQYIVLICYNSASTTKIRS